MKAGDKVREMAKSVALCVALFFGAASILHAQPSLDLKRVINNWPTIEIYFAATCNGQVVSFLGAQNFEVYENGVRIDDFTMWCPDPGATCAISFALVFDCSGNMNGVPLAAEIQAGLQFVSGMDGTLDEGCVVKFESSATLVQSMTTSKSLLSSAIGDLTTGNLTACWDGCYQGLLEIIRAGTNPCRAVIFITDGRDNSSTHTPQQIIDLATRNRVRVFTIGLGGVFTGELQSIANSTGGRYYDAPTLLQLNQIYEDISSIMHAGFYECLIAYQARCMDGARRVVDLVLKNVCGGTDQKSKTYTAPKDTSTFADIIIKLGRGTVKGGQEVKIPLILDTPVKDRNFYPATFTVRIVDSSCTMQFRKIETPPGTLLEGVPISVTPAGRTITFQTTQRKILQGDGRLAELTFLTEDPSEECCSEIALASWTFEQGCDRVISVPGEICVIPLRPQVECAITAPDALLWDRGGKDYTPNPFAVTMTVTNFGERDAKNARFKITYAKSDFALAGPFSDVQPGMPKDVTRGSGQSEARWDLLAKRRTAGRNVDVCITASFDNYPDVNCCATIFIPPAMPILDCAISAPKIVADKIEQKYNPMPFDLTVTVHNTGGSVTDTVFASIIVPPDLALSGPDAPNHNTKIVSNALAANGQATAGWQLTHPVSLVQTDYTVSVWVRTANADSAMCEYKITIPPLDAPTLQPRCSAPDSLHVDAGVNGYTPNPFTVTLECKNAGGLSAQNVSAFIYLPADVVLENPLDSLRKTFNPRTLDPWRPGGAMPTVSWRVRYTKKLRYDRQLDFKFVVGGTTPLGIGLDTVETWCEVRAPGMAPAFDCMTILPDSCGLNPVGSDVTPNPFTLVYKVWNTSNMPSRIATVAVQWPEGQGVILDPASQSAVKTVDAALNPGETLTVYWTFRAQKRITRRLVTFGVAAVDEDGLPIQTCSDNLPIAALSTALACDVQSSETVLAYRQATQEYVPQSFVISGTLTNQGGTQLHNAWARIEKDDPYDFVEFDPSYTDPVYFGNDTLRFIGYISPGQTKAMTWGFRLKRENHTGVSQYVAMDVHYKSDETPEVLGGVCRVVIEIAPMILPQLACTLYAPDTIHFLDGAYSPSPFDLRMRIENVGTADALNVKAFVLQNTRFSIVPPSFMSFDTLSAGKAINPFSNPGFRLTVNPRANDGFDTVRVMVVADGIPSFTCDLPILVMHEQRPRFAVQCDPETTALSFDDRLHDYVPNPFSVTIRVANIGDAKAAECRLAFIGSPRFTPEKDAPIEAFGTLDTGGTFTTTWKIRALCRPAAGVDTLRFLVQGRGGIADRLVTDTACVLVSAPACRAPDYGIGCEQAHRFTFDIVSGRYMPDVVRVSDTIRNNGLALGVGLQATISLPPGLYLESGESPTKTLNDIGPGEAAVVWWIVRPIARMNDTTLTVRVLVEDAFGASAECGLTRIFVPRATNYVLFCETGSGPDFPDALKVNAQLGVYEGRPFNATITVTNAGQLPLDSVCVLILPDSRDIIITGNPMKIAASRLEPGSAVPVVWPWDCQPRTMGGNVRFRFVVTAKSSIPSECDKNVFIPEIGRPHLDVILSTIPTDTLHYDQGMSDFEGERSANGNYNVFTVKANVTNIGAAQANGVTATILPPSGLTLDDGESAIKPVVPPDLIVNGQGVVSWKFRPLRRPTGEPGTLNVQVASQNARSVTNDVVLFIQGAPKNVTLMIPMDNVGKYGDRISVPVGISPTIGNDVFAYRLNIRYDPRVVRFQGASNTATLTEYGWNGPRTSQYADVAPDGMAVARVEDFTTGTTLNSRDTGVLVFLTFEAVYNQDRMNYAQSNIDMVDFTPDGAGAPLLTSMNSIADNLPGDVVVKRVNGQITVSGECITPLNSLPQYQLRQNKPNPFNPSTVIEYEIPEETVVTLHVFDQLGREVRTMPEGRRKPGKYSVLFDATGLPTGTYMYRITTMHYSKSLRMILTR